MDFLCGLLDAPRAQRDRNVQEQSGQAQYGGKVRTRNSQDRHYAAHEPERKGANGGLVGIPFQQELKTARNTSSHRQWCRLALAHFFENLVNLIQCLLLGRNCLSHGSQPENRRIRNDWNPSLSLCSTDQAFRYTQLRLQVNEFHTKFLVRHVKFPFV